MKLADLIKENVQNRAPRIVLHGIHGIGKTSWAAKAPNPVFILTEDGLGKNKVKSFPLCEDIDSAYKYLDLLINEKNDYQTVVIDTVDWLEKIIWHKVCQSNGVKSIEQIGYGRGYMFAIQHWEMIIDKLNAIDKTIVLLAHNEIKTYNPPDSDAYDRYQIKLHRHAAAKIEEWADIVLFANFKIFVDSENKKAINKNIERVVYSCNRPAWRAKTRYDIPDELPLDFNALINAIKGDVKNG